MTDDVQKRERLKAHIAISPLEEDTKAGFFEAAAKMASSDLVEALERFDRSQSSLELFRGWVNNQLEQNQAADTSSPAPAGREPVRGLPTLNSKMSESSIQLAAQQIRDVVLRAEPLMPISFIKAYLERVELYSFKSGDISSLVYFCEIVCAALLRSLGRRKAEALEIAESLVLCGLSWNPGNVSLWGRWASVRVGNGDYDTAATIFSEARRRFPSRIHIVDQFALFLCDRVGDYRSALNVLDSAIPYLDSADRFKKMPFSETYFDVLLLNYVRGNSDATIDRIIDFIDYSDQSNLFYGLSNLFLKKYDFELPAADSEKIIKKIKRSKEILTHIYKLKYHVGHYDDVFFLVERELKNSGFDIKNTHMRSEKKTSEYIRRLSRRRSLGRGFEFSIEDQIKEARLEPISDDLSIMGSLKFLHDSNDLVKIGDFITQLERNQASERTLTYAHVLLIRGGSLHSFEAAKYGFATAFELALRTGDVRTLRLLSQRKTKREALCLVARSVLGDVSAFEEIVATLASESSSDVADVIDLKSCLRATELLDAAEDLRFMLSAQQRRIAENKLSDLNISMI
jgi:hypothetical protein